MQERRPIKFKLHPQLTSLNREREYYLSCIEIEPCVRLIQFNKLHAGTYTHIQSRKLV